MSTILLLINRLLSSDEQELYLVPETVLCPLLSLVSWDFLSATLKPHLHDTTGCQTGCCIVYTNIQPVSGSTTGCIVYTAGCQTGWLFVQPGWTNSGCSFNTVVKPVAKPVVEPVWQQVVSCKRGFRVASLTIPTLLNCHRLSSLFSGLRVWGLILFEL